MCFEYSNNLNNRKNKKRNSKTEKLNNSTFVILIFEIPKYRSFVTFPYKVVINNHNVTIEGNPILFNYSQEFTQNFGISQPS